MPSSEHSAYASPPPPAATLAHPPTVSQQAVPPPPPPRAPTLPPKATAIAMYDFDGEQTTDLPFKAGDVITILQKTESTNDWWKGVCNGREGLASTACACYVSPAAPTNLFDRRIMYAVPGQLCAAAVG
ncbi:SH3 domain-containing protein [Thamnocephalis sphaerospora]|uniref:SH3 domain-containing protein n=1 Tax=Thamnocephalis sphaerospora TaxID=78915 RepID=A0A4P9XSS7_9FUNG|nr:SH3 domain-containing protein [Thamnocephalis sphaerospora]|eukprot:RKP08571.1 SH3 domain-containing protein [Thamnocephalis sphaerospora]